MEKFDKVLLIAGVGYQGNFTFRNPYTIIKHGLKFKKLLKFNGERCKFRKVLVFVIFFKFNFLKI